MGSVNLLCRISKYNGRLSVFHAYSLAVTAQCTNIGASRQLSASSRRNSEYRLVYKLPVIRIAGLVNKMKLYQTWVTGLSVPGSIALQLGGVISPETVIPIVGIGLTSLVAVYAIGLVSNQLVGFVYISSDSKSVRISHLDSWGKRIDTDCPVEDIVPISELSDNPKSMYMHIKRYSTKDTMKLSLKYGNIMDNELFRKVFGHLPIS